MKKARVLLINDFVATGRVALNLQEAYLKNQGIETLSIPSAGFSNTFNLGKPVMIDTTQFLEKTIEQFASLNIDYDGIFIGYLANEQQTVYLENFLLENRHLPVLIDPIMGDKGIFYKSLDTKMIDWYQRLIKHCDLFIPNMTEAQFLLNYSEIKTDLNHQEALKLLMDCQAINKRSVVITSMTIDTQRMIMGYDHTLSEVFMVDYDKVAGDFYGTGDLFSAVVFEQNILKTSLKKASEMAHQKVNEVLINS